jgi:hypothetical protein
MSADPIVIDAQTVRADDEIRVEIHDHRGVPFFSARHWHRIGDRWQVGRGLTVRTTLLPWLSKAIVQAEEKARAAGLIR